MNLPGRTTIQGLDGGPELWRALDTLALATPETLDGRWTAADVSGASLKLLSVTPGTYIRSGRQVTATVGMRWPVTTSTAPAMMGGLPCRCVPTNNHAAIVLYTTAGITFTALVGAGTTTIFFYHTTGGPVTNAEFSDAHVQVTAIYFTT